MFLPLSDNFPKLNFPLVTGLLIAINCLVYYFATRNPIDAGNAAVLYGAVPYELTHSGTQCVPQTTGFVCLPTAEMQAHYPNVDFPPAWQTVFTSMFLHGGFGHLIGNMIYLFVFGWALENTLGKFSFSLFYIVGGFAALLGQTLVDPNSGIPMVGASGAIAAVLAGYLVLFPMAKILSLFIIFPCRPRAYVVLGSWLVLNLLMAWFTAGIGGGVAVFAHLGGFAAGVALTYVIVNREEMEHYRVMSEKAKGWTGISVGGKAHAAASAAATPAPPPQYTNPWERYEGPAAAAPQQYVAPAPQRYVAPPPQQYVAPPPAAPQQQQQPPAA